MRVQIDGVKFGTKPTGRQIGGIKSRLTDHRTIKDLTARRIAAALASGHTVQPGVCPFSEESRAKGNSGTVKEDFTEQTLFMNDHDNKKKDFPIETPAGVAETLAGYGVEIAFAYDTFNSTAEHERFRIGIVSDQPFTDPAERERVQAALIKKFPQSDTECINADRIFFGTDKGLLEGIGNIDAVCSKENLLAFADAVLAEENGQETNGGESDGGIIPEGQREQAMFAEATRLLTRYGDTAETRAKYDSFITRLEVIPGESDPPQKKADYVYKRCQKHYHTTTEKRPGYQAPDEYNTTAQADFSDTTKKKKNSISHYMQLSSAYKREHTYVVGVQRLCKGGFGNDTLYEYNGGVWKARSESDVKSDLAAIVTRHGTIPDPTHTEKAYKVIMSTGRRKDVETFNADENLVCFKNGVYRLSDGAVLEHSPEYYFTLQLNASIPAKLEPTPYCDMCLANFGGTDVQTLLLEIFGGGISNVHMYRFKKGVLQYGVGDSGKTQLKGLAERVVGAGNYNNVDLSDLENNRFLSAAFQNVRIGGSNDMSNVRVKEEKVFKQLTGGDSIQAENKGENSFTFRYKGLLWFLANQLPLFGGDKGEHVYKRWIVIPCKNAIPEEMQIKDLQDRMYAERDSFCIKALQAFQKAVANNYTFSIPASCQTANDEYRRKNSVVRTFIEECCEPFNRDTCTKEQTTGKFWTTFKTWCADGLYYTPGKAEFRKELATIAGVDESNLESHTKDGNYYPYVVTVDALKEIQPGFLPPLYG